MTIKWQISVAYDCLVAGQNQWAQALTARPMGCTSALSVTHKAPLQLRYAACGIMCYMPLPELVLIIITCKLIKIPANSNS